MLHKTCNRKHETDNYPPQPLLRIIQVLWLNDVEHLVYKLACLPAGHGQVVEEPVATVFGGSTGNVAVKIGNKHEGAAHQIHDIF